MPIYDYKCECGIIQQDVFAKIDATTQPCSCGGTAQRVIGMTAAPQIFKAGWYRDIAAEPIHCKSKADLRFQCAEHDCHSDYAG